MATSRVRKAFKYPSDDDASEPDELDEEHQENLITSLRASDARQNTLYRSLFLAIPLLSALFSLATLLLPSTPQHRLLALLSLTSLLCTAYILQFMPLEAPDPKGKRAIYRVEAAKGPVERYLVAVNAVLAGLLGVVACVSGWRGLRARAWREALPVIVYGLGMVVRREATPVDLRGLERAKYDYKGA